MTRRVFLIFLRIFQRIYYWFLQLKGLVVFGRRVRIFGNFYVARPENVTIGANCSINYGVFILGYGRLVIGNHVTISARAMLIDAGLLTDNLTEKQHLGQEIVIEDGVWIGAGAIILPGVTLGSGSVVGAGAVVTRNVPSNVIVAGVPARPVGGTDN